VLHLVDHIRNELPSVDQSAIKTVVWKGNMIVLADAYRLSFVLESMLAYLLRVRAGKGSVVVKLRMLDTTVEVSMAGPARRHGPAPNLGQIVEDARTNIALAAGVLEEFSKNFGGSFKHYEPVQGREKLVLRLPAAVREPVQLSF
jgi:hypothetical protein